MSTPTTDTDALATEEMLKMFENMADSEPETLEVADAIADAEDQAMSELDDLDNLSMDEELPEASDANTLSAEALELDDGGLDELGEMAELNEAGAHVAGELDQDIQLAEEGNDDLSASTDQDDLQLDNALESVADTTEEDMLAEMDSSDAPMAEATSEADDMPLSAPETASMEESQGDTAQMAAAAVANNSTGDAPITEHLNAVVENAIQALQDWLSIRAQSEDRQPQQQQVAQLDALLDTVTHQQQQLATQLEKAASVNLSPLAKALGVTLPTPEALGWGSDEWRTRAQQVANKTEDIAAMNARLRQQLDKL